MTNATSPPGINLDVLARWMDKNLPGLRDGDLRATLIAGGKSNLTYRLSDDSSTWALRRPPLGHVLPTAHDMSREFRVITALNGTKVPVPQSVALCQDSAVLGAPFYLMGFVDGLVLDNEDALVGITPQAAGRIGELLVDSLVALHTQAPADIGLSEFGRPEGFLARQLKRWHQQWMSSETRPLDSLDTVVAKLAETLPSTPRSTIVHGDYRLGNTIFAPTLDRINAVIDWEMATLGDPFTDLGLLIVYQSLAAEGGFGLAPLRPADGFLTADQLATRYGQSVNRDMARLSWYVGFAYFKLAVISEGIRYRHLAGQTIGAGFDAVGDSVPTLLQAALECLAADSSN